MKHDNARTRKNPRDARSSPDTTRERVYHIAGLMTRDEWVRGKTANDLAERWGLARSTIDQMASEASRLRQLVAGGLDELEEWYRLRLQEIAGENREDRVRAIEVALKNLGRLHEKQDVTVRTDMEPDLVVQRAARSMLKDPDSRKILVEQMQLHAPELLAPELRLVQTQGESVD